MCGIAGVYDSARGGSERLVEELAGALAHRGPDGIRVWSDGPVALGHTRLKILDLTAAAEQPMRSADGNLRMVYNGEVYNYVELRSELEGLGHRFTSTGDTEVVLAAYVEWGNDCFARFNGMFALAIWDARRRTLLLARDPFGIKPLYLRRTGTMLAFASEPGALTSLGPVGADEQVLGAYLNLAAVDADPTRTFFREIERMPAGATLVVDASGERIGRYWSLAVDSEVATLTTDERAEHLRELFLDAVRIRLRSDVKVGSCLSGGLDSSAVVAAMAANCAADADAFTAWIATPELDERRFARIAADAAGCHLHEVEVSAATITADLAPAILVQAEPFSSTSVIAQRAVMRLASSTGSVVVLDGQGGDELFAGYPSAIAPAILTHVRDLQLGHALDEFRSLAERTSVASAAVEIVRPLAPLRSRARLRRRAEGALSSLAAVSAGGRGLSLTAHRRFLLERQGLPALLRYEDRNSMAFSVESRLPFLDPRLVRFAYSLPTEELIRRGQTKWLLRRALGGLLPDAIRRRTDKIGFAPPESEWTASVGAQIIRDVLLDDETRRRGWIDVSRAGRLLDEHVAGGRNASRSLWRALNAELWARAFKI